jgi:hypothetical protein
MSRRTKKRPDEDELDGCVSGCCCWPDWRLLPPGEEIHKQLVLLAFGA